MEVSGFVRSVGEVEQVSPRFKVRKLVLEFEENNYAQFVEIQFNQDRVALLDAVEVGTLIRVQFDLGGNQWTNPQGVTKTFNKLTGWRVDVAQQPKTPPQAPAVVAGAGSTPTVENVEVQDEIPF